MFNADPALLQRRLRRSCVAEIHSSWWDEIVPAGLRWRPRSARGVMLTGQGRLLALRGSTRSRTGVPALSELQGRLLELAPSVLERLIECIGLVMIGSEVRQAIAKRDVQAYQEALGLELHRFTARAAALLGGVDEAASNLKLGPKTIRAACQSCGLRIVENLAQEVDAEWLLRLRLRLPRHWLTTDPAYIPDLRRVCGAVSAETVVRRVMRVFFTSADLSKPEAGK